MLRPGAIGDTLLTLPALALLRHGLPDHQIEVAGNPTALPLVMSTGLIDSWLPFDNARVTRLFVPVPPRPAEWPGRLDAAVAWCSDPDGTLRHAFRVRGATRVVIAPSRPAAEPAIHVAHYLRGTLTPLGIDPAPTSALPLIRPSADARVTAETELGFLGLLGRPFVAVHPGSGSRAKNWPPARFAEVIRDLQGRGLGVLVLGGPADDGTFKRLDTHLHTPAPRLVNRPLEVVAAVLQRARAYLGNDSGLSHLAGLLDLPTLALFGPTDPALWQPLGPRVTVLRHQPLDELAAGDVLAALLDLARLD